MNDNNMLSKHFVLQEESSGGQAAELNLDNVGGVFLVLVLGVLVAVMWTTWVLVWDIGCYSIKHKVRSFVTMHNIS